MADAAGGIDLPRSIDGGALEWDLPAGVLLEEDFFPAVSAGPTLYRGANWSLFYKGIQSDAVLYRGAGTLHA